MLDCFRNMSLRFSMRENVSVVMVRATAIIIAAYMIIGGAAKIPSAAMFAKASKPITAGSMMAISFCLVDKSFNRISLPC